MSYENITHLTAKKSLLSVRNVINRNQWCKWYAKVDPIFWNDVLFSDEIRLEPLSRRREYVRRPQGSRYNPKYTTKTEIWRKKYHGFGRHKSRWNQNYHKVSGSHEFYWIWGGFEAHNTFQQNDTPCHKSKVVSSLLDKAMICVISGLPAQYRIWIYLSCCCLNRKPRFPAANQTILKHWGGVVRSSGLNLYESIPRRIQEVLKKKGLSTRY